MHRGFHIAPCVPSNQSSQTFRIDQFDSSNVLKSTIIHLSQVRKISHWESKLKVVLLTHMRWSLDWSGCYICSSILSPSQQYEFRNHQTYMRVWSLHPVTSLSYLLINFFCTTDCKTNHLYCNWQLFLLKKVRKWKFWTSWHKNCKKFKTWGLYSFCSWLDFPVRKSVQVNETFCNSKWMAIST